MKFVFNNNIIKVDCENNMGVFTYKFRLSVMIHYMKQLVCLTANDTFRETISSFYNKFKLFVVIH